MLRIGFVCPTYKANELHTYTLKSLTSFFATTPGGVAVVVDDASAGWDQCVEEYKKLPNKNQAIYFHRFSVSGGLTRSWNYGLKLLEDLGVEYGIAGNNDIIFPSKLWHQGLLHAIANGYDLVGPLSNAPGVTAKGKQSITRYASQFTLTDDLDYLKNLQDQLAQNYPGYVLPSPINGFFMLAKMATWRIGQYADECFFRPVNTHTSKGRRNPTPLMTGNEDELQGRWSKQGLKSAIVLSSFIFHYRAVSRGSRYKKEGWFRNG